MFDVWFLIFDSTWRIESVAEDGSPFKKIPYFVTNDIFWFDAEYGANFLRFLNLFGKTHWFGEIGENAKHFRMTPLGKSLSDWKEESLLVVISNNAVVKSYISEGPHGWWLNAKMRSIFAQFPLPMVIPSIARNPYRKENYPHGGLNTKKNVIITERRNLYFSKENRK